MGVFAQDVKHSLRRLIKTPGFTAIRVVILAVAIGANTVVLSVINAVLLRPFPGHRQGALMRVYYRSKQPDGGYSMFSYPCFRELQEQNTSFAGLSAFVWTGVGMQTQDVTYRTGAAYVSSNFFDTFGVRMARGRPFVAEEEQPGSRIPVVVASHRLWKRLGSDPDLIGRQISINNVPMTVVGILPKTFVSASQITNFEIWLPLGMIGAFSSGAAQDGSPLNDHGYRKLFIVGQVKPGQTRAMAQSELEILAGRLAATYPQEYRDCELPAGPMAHVLVRPSPTDDFQIGLPLAALVVASGAVLLVACMNLAGMSTVSGMRRQQELAIRFALGAGRTRIIRQFAAEGLLLSLLGGAAGVLLALWSSRFLVRSLEQFTGGEATIPVELDGRLLGMVAGLCVFSTLLFSVIPACRLSGTCIIAYRKGSTASAGGGREWWRDSLVAAQTAMAFVLVTTAGLFVRSAWQASHADPGFALERGLLVEIDPGLMRYDQQRSRETYRALLERLRETPGVRTVSLGRTVPFGDPYMARRYRRADSPPSPSGNVGPFAEPTSHDARYNIIGCDYFQALGVPLLRGREFTLLEEQSAQGPRVAIIDELTARRLWPGEDPVGRYLQQEGDSKANAMQVVGVVPHLCDAIAEPEPNPHVYVPSGQHFSSDMTVHVRLDGAPGRAAEAAMKRVILRELKAIEPSLPILGIRTWREHVSEFSMQYWTIHMGAKIFASLGLMALLLAAAGLFAIKSFLVAQRTREIGVRMALGATRRRVLREVMCEGSIVVLSGLGAGALLSWAGTRFLKTLLLGVSPADVVLYIAAASVLMTAVLLASYLPARRATRVDPMVALRCE